MFANFELYSGGWVDADQTRRRRRSRKGCIPCRQRRKKCDESRPVCGQCSARRVACGWRRISLDGRGSYLAEDTQGSLSSSPTSYQSPGVTGSISSESDAGGVDSPGDMAVSFPLSSLTPSNAFSECAKTLPSCSVVDLLQVFDRATSGHDFGGEYSFLAQGFPWLSKSPSMLHAWLSCSAMLISQFQTSWRDHALRQYTKAIGQLRRSIQNGATLEDESSFATILILHVFGRFGDPRGSAAHLSAAVRLHAIINRPPSNTHDALVLEAFIYQVAINSTFRPSPMESYGGLSRVIELWLDSSVLQQSASSPYLTRAGLTAFVPIWAFDVIFKVSHLLRNRRNISLDEMQAKLSALHTQLDKLQQGLSPGNSRLDEGDEAGISKGKQVVPGSAGLVAQGEVVIPLNLDMCSPHEHTDEGFHMRHLYFLAASLLILKLACPATTVQDLSVTTLFKSALLHLRHVRSDLPFLLWAVTVLGVAASSSQEKSVIIAHVEAMRHFAGERAVGSVLRFFASAWGSEPLEMEDECPIGRSDSVWTRQEGFTSLESFGYLSDGSGSALGLDVLFNESLMSTVIV